MRKSILLLISMMAVSGFLFSFAGREEPFLPMVSEDEMAFMGPMGPGPMGPATGIERFGRWWKQSRFVKELNLTDEQINKLDKIFLDTQKKIVDLHAACRKAELELRSLEGKEAESLKKIDEIYRLRAEIQKNIFLMTNQIKKELTPEQLKKLEEIKREISEERRARLKERWAEKRRR